MLPVTRWFIKAGMIYLVAGLFLLFADSLPAVNTTVNLLPVYWHMIVVGWITQVIMGVSIWMFPRKSRDRKKTGTLHIWMIFWLLNIGLVLRFLAEPFLGSAPVVAVFQWAVILSVACQLSASVLYVIEIWPRLKKKQTSRR